MNACKFDVGEIKWRPQAHTTHRVHTTTAIYVPLSRRDPWEDRRARLTDAGARVLLTTANTSTGEDWSRFTGDGDDGLCVVLRLDPLTGAVVEAVGAGAAGGKEEAEGQDDEGLEGAFNILYTSGSTGPPKGVRGWLTGPLAFRPCLGMVDES